MSGQECGDCIPNDDPSYPGNNTFDFQVSPRPEIEPSKLAIGAYMGDGKNFYTTEGGGDILYSQVFFQPNKWKNDYMPYYSINALNLLAKESPGAKQIGSYNTKYTYIDSKTSVKIEPNHLYAVKSDGSDWSSLEEIGETRDWQLRYYDSYEEAAQHGVVVAELYEFRGGIFLSYITIGKQCTFTGDKNTTMANTLDARMWEKDQKLTVEDTWKNTNGVPVQEDTFNGHKIDHSQLAMPGPAPTELNLYDT